MTPKQSKRLKPGDRIRYVPDFGGGIWVKYGTVVAVGTVKVKIAWDPVPGALAMRRVTPAVAKSQYKVTSSRLIAHTSMRGISMVLERGENVRDP